MKSITFGLAVLMLGATVRADPATAPWTPTAPPPDSSAVATNNAALPVVLVIPFQQVGDTSRYQWVAQALQEDLAGQVAQGAMFVPRVSDKPLLGSDSSSALQAAHDAGAAIVIFGSYQSMNDQIRVTAQVADVASGRIVGTLQATGGVTDLFKMEDSLAQQLHQILPQPASEMPQISYGTANGPITSAPLPDNYAAPAPDAYASPDYSSDNSSYGSPYSGGYYPPSYGYYPPYFYGGFIIVNNFHNHFHDGHFHTWNGNWNGMHGGAWGGMRGSAMHSSGLSAGHR
jgi:TolB-like protein